MRVIAPQGQTCPREEDPRTYITDATAVDVEPSAYYLRLLDDGSLIKPPAKAAPALKEVSTDGK
jgi:hypothetical protein